MSQIDDFLDGKTAPPQQKSEIDAFLDSESGTTPATHPSDLRYVDSCAPRNRQIHFTGFEWEQNEFPVVECIRDAFWPSYLAVSPSTPPNATLWPCVTSMGKSKFPR